MPTRMPHGLSMFAALVALALPLTLAACNGAAKPKDDYGKAPPPGSGDKIGSYGMSEIIDRAEKGNLYYQRMLAQCYRYGKGVPQNDAKALKWDMAPANEGNPGSQYDVAMHYLKGRGANVNADEAGKWMEKSAAQKYKPAMFQLGLMMRKGTGVTFNPDGGLALIRKAALAGYKPAKTMMLEQYGEYYD